MIQIENPNVLVNRLGSYIEERPIAALRGHFCCVWVNRLAIAGAVDAVVVPDGCVDLMWRDGTFTVVGPDLRGIARTVNPGTILGLRFHPGVAADWLGFPLQEIAGREIPMFDVWGLRAAEMSEQVHAEPSLSSQLLRLQELIAARIMSQKDSPHRAATIVRMLERRAAPGSGIRELPDHLNMSERSLRRWSLDHFGYSIKTLDRILRLQRLRALAEGGGNIGLAGLAFEAGYADQAHLSREIQSLCGMTARQFVSQLAT